MEEGTKLESFEESRINEVIDVLSEAYATNPIFVKIFGGSTIQRLRMTHHFFRISMSCLCGDKMVAVDGKRIVGVIHWSESPACYPSLLKIARLARSLLLSLQFSAFGIARWIYAWSRADPRGRHCHLGPIAVLPEYQGKGIGNVLMHRYCKHLERNHENGYLETDKSVNVEFYKRYGFEVTKEQKVLGVSTWLMQRRLHE